MFAEKTQLQTFGLQIWCLHAFPKLKDQVSNFWKHGSL